MELRNQRIRQSNRDITLLLIPLVAVVAKLIQLFILPGKYFFDSWRMVSMLTEQDFMVAWSGYETTVDFYRAINIFDFTSIEQWSITLGLVMTPMMMVVISRTKEMEIRETVFVLMAAGLLNIYVFGITKEMIQILFFFAIYIIISLPIKNTFIKLLGCAAIFYWESTFYRGYYIIMAAMTIAIYFIILWLRKSEKISKKKVFMAIVFCFVTIFVMFYVSKFVMPEDFQEAINVRDISANEGANTVILNPIEVNGNYGIFMFDYVIAAVRMMFPIELLIKSPIYAPFVLYQFFILYYFIKALKNLKQLENDMVVAISCFTAYLFGSFVFEPDFGSWVRHEAATFPILQFLALRSNTYNGLSEVNNEAENV